MNIVRKHIKEVYASAVVQCRMMMNEFIDIAAPALFATRWSRLTFKG